MYQKLRLLFNTIKYLKAKQIYYRIYYRFRKVKPLHIAENTESACNDSLVNLFEWHGDSYAPQSIFDDGTARFLNLTQSIESASIWNDDSKAKLWLYNLHYFDDLNSIGSDVRVKQQQQFIHRWIEQNPPVGGNGWEPYTLSLRIVNIIKWSSRHKVKDAFILNSLIQQADALYQQLEYHILANHLFANLKALVFVGVYFSDDIGKRYLDKGLPELNEQMNEQFLKDGAHYELSPMYHSVMLWDVLELIDLAQRSNHPLLATHIDTWKSIAIRGVNWLEAMCHPDGNISFFNDAAMGIAATPEMIRAYATKLGINLLAANDESIILLSSSGYTRVNCGSKENVLLVNHAEIGPDYQPGHAHADTLSFELTLFGHRVFVNTGTSQYGLGAERNRQRSTLAHNTLAVGEYDSSEVWNGFRVAKRANIIEYTHEKIADKLVISAAHDGYTRIDKKLVHKRIFVAEKTSLTINDSLANAQAVNAVCRYHLHPNVKIIDCSEHSAKLQLPNGVIFNVEVIGGTLSRHGYQYLPQFGIRLDSEFFEVSLTDEQLEFRVSWDD